MVEDIDVAIIFLILPMEACSQVKTCIVHPIVNRQVAKLQQFDGPPVHIDIHILLAVPAHELARRVQDAPCTVHLRS